MKILQIEMVKNSTESFRYLLQSKFMLIHHIRLKNSRNPRISDFRNAFSSCFLFISQENGQLNFFEDGLKPKFEITGGHDSGDHTFV